MFFFRVFFRRNTTYWRKLPSLMRLSYYELELEFLNEELCEIATKFRTFKLVSALRTQFPIDIG